MEKYKIHAYKHDGNIHGEWDSSYLLEELKDYKIFYNKNVKVVESNGVVWKTKEEAIVYFFEDEWFNIIAQNKKEGLSYYCNITSPYIIEDGVIKYIDYDLDLRLFPTKEYKILDRKEYDRHRKKMNYGRDLEKVIEASLEDLISKVESNTFEPFFDEKNLKLIEKARLLQKSEKKSKKMIKSLD